MHILVRSLEQLDAALELPLPEKVATGTIYCDFEDVRKYPQAITRCRAAKRPVMLATTRIVKPGEEGLLGQLLACQPDGILVRNLAALSYFREKAPNLPLVGDYALNVANELTAGLLHEAGLSRLTASYDLNWRQMRAMVARAGADLFEMVVHQHMPMFHMEHCVFAHTLSTGTDATNCGRPCERHQVVLRDRIGEKHPLVADVGCRNTLYNAVAQSAAEFVPEMLPLGVCHFRVELLRETAGETKDLLCRYIRVFSGEEQAGEMLHSLRVLQQLGVNRGTLERE